MRNKVNIYFFLLIALFINLEAKTQNVVSEDYLNAIEESRKLIVELKEDQMIPGVQVAVMVDGEIVWTEGFGLANVELQVPMTPEIKMRIGSVSKTFTSAAIGKLMAAGQLDIDKPVRDYVPYFPEKRYVITSRLVAGHLAGIRHYRDLEFLSNKNYFSVEEGIAIFTDDTLLYKPGEKYFYSSYGYNLLSAVVEGSSGRDFLTYMQEEVFDPLDMGNTTADFTVKIIPDRTSFYALVNDTLVNAPFVDNSYKWAGGGFLSTCKDIVKFGDAFLDDDYLSEEIIKELWRSQQTSDGKLTNYGIGWSSGESEKGKWYGHAGGSVGGSTQFVVYPEQGVVFAIMSNIGGVNYDGLHHKISGIFMELE